MANAGTWVSILSILSKLYPQKVGRNLALIGLAMGFGAIVGPVLGAELNNLGGFTLPFFTVAALQCMLTFATTCYIPSVEKDLTLAELIEEGQLRVSDIFRVMNDSNLF